MAAPWKSETVDDDHPMEEEKHGLNLYETFCVFCMLFFLVQTITMLQDYWSKRYYTRVTKLQALEVICNPPNEKDVKSVEELQKEYPQLFTISD
ncbi:hypothetical protein Q3G72_020593 [Acer saccharum]|nr:hypothetical protein Q3G72_020593 [Acer saccharum]